VRTTFTNQPDPTPERARVSETARCRCRDRYHTALLQRRTWGGGRGRGQGSGARCYRQQAELPELQAARPDYGERNARVVQAVIVRGARAFQAFFRRVTHGATPGAPRLRGARALHQRAPTRRMAAYGGGAVLDGGVLRRATLGHLPRRPHRPLARHAQDGHALQRGGRLVGVPLVRRPADPRAAPHR
jgi:hypothetical protein